MVVEAVRIREPMKTMRYNWLLPACLLAVAALAGWACFMISGFSYLQSSILALSVFCTLAVVFLYGWVIWRSRQTERKLQESLLIETEILERLKSQDTSRHTGDGKILARLSRLERQLEAIESADAARKPQTAIPPDMVTYDDKVVPLTAARKPASGDQESNARYNRQKVLKFLDEGRYFFRLQPIINLLDKRLVGLEAFAYCAVNEGIYPVRDFTDKVPANRRSQLDMRLVKGLSGLIRQLEKDGTLVPIHFRLAPNPGEDREGWEQVLQTLRADPKLQEHLIPVIDPVELEPGKSSVESWLLSLREAGLKLCIESTGNPQEVAVAIKSRHYSSLKIGAADLLRYRKSERERVADQLLPVLDRHGIPIFVTKVDQAHQASQLIDLDIAGAQGDYIGAVRALKIYRDMDPHARKSEPERLRPIV